MSKLGEINYLGNIGNMGQLHSLNKPFSDEFCGINLASLGFIMALLPTPPARVLDLGCGGGWTSVFFAKRGYDVVGQDIAADMVELALSNKEQNNLGDNLAFLCSDYEGLAFQSEFDCAIFFDSLHHSEDELQAIRSAYRALKPGGMLLTHEPGSGHAASPASIQAMEDYGVNERDMPPQLIIDQGRKVGFREFRIYPMPNELMSVFFTTQPPQLWSKYGFKLIRRMIRLIFRPSLRSSAIVVMKK